MTRRSSKQGAINDDYGQQIDDMDDIFTRLERLESPSGEALGSSLGRIAANIAELQARETFATEQAYVEQVDLGTPLPYETPPVSAITFTLAARRRVRLTGSMYVGLLVWTLGDLPATDPRILIQFRLGITDETGGTTYMQSSISTGAGWNSGVRALSRRADRPYSEDYRVLNPGTYTLTLSARVDLLEGTGGSVSFASPKTSVEILEKVA